MGATVIQGRCELVLPSIPDNSVDLILTDPPYFKVKGDWWDHQWAKPEGFLSWLDGLAAEWQRILKPNGSLMVFASPKMAARVEVLIGERFEVLNGITWAKDQGWHRKTRQSDQRSFLSPWERIVFAEQRGADGYARGESSYTAACDELRGFVFEPLRAYLDGERERAGVTPEECDIACGFATPGGMASRHYFSRSQFQLPRLVHYEALRRAFGAGHLRREYEDLRREYEDLRREYEDLRREYEDLRRPFHVTPDVQFTDVWTFPTVGAYKGKHPCEKPAALLEHAISATTKPGGVVLDCFAGSGSTLAAALRLGRQAIGIEVEDRWVRQCRNAAAVEQLQLAA